jgi:hypothetical protein
MNFLKRFSFRYWGRWVGFYYTNYDFYAGNDEPRWSGFHLGLGFATLMYHISMWDMHQKKQRTNRAS